MLRKTFVIFWLMFLSVWLGVIAPGHERGSIRLPGSSCQFAGSALHTSQQAQAVATGSPWDTPASSPCCATANATAQNNPAAPDNQPPSDAASCCAVCYLNSVLNTPDVIVLVQFRSGLLEELHPLDPAALQSISACLSRHIRGPPSVA